MQKALFCLHPHPWNFHLFSFWELCWEWNFTMRLVMFIWASFKFNPKCVFILIDTIHPLKHNLDHIAQSLRRTSKLLRWKCRKSASKLKEAWAKALHRFSLLSMQTGWPKGPISTHSISVYILLARMLTHFSVGGTFLSGQSVWYNLKTQFYLLAFRDLRP